MIPTLRRAVGYRVRNRKLGIQRRLPVLSAVIAVFYGETGGGFASVDAKSGKTLWHFEANQIWKGLPITHAVKGKHVAIASGGNLLAFALPD